MAEEDMVKERVGEEVRRSMFQEPKVEGPVPVTEQSHMFASMAHARRPLDLEKRGYLEEEYFVEGCANIYENEGDELRIRSRGNRYKTRVIARMPKNGEDFSGQVYIDIMNASTGMDIEDFWHRMYDWCMENGHAYVGVTSKPITVWSLKKFDYQRYQSLDWSADEKIARPCPPIGGAIPGTEVGLLWDILGQVGYAVRQGTFVGGRKAGYLCLTGQSQSGASLDTFVRWFDKYLTDERGKHLYDAYFNMVAAGMERGLNQSSDVLNGLPFSALESGKMVSSVPYVTMASEGDKIVKEQICRLGKEENIPRDSDTLENKFRCYIVAASSHADTTNPLFPCDEDVKKLGFVPGVSGERKSPVNPFPLSNYMKGALGKLYRWSTEGTAPESVPPIAKDENGEYQRDGHGNAVGGFRSPYVDLPTATYTAYVLNVRGGICGTYERFSEDKLKEMYGSKTRYMELFREYLERQRGEGWLCERDVEDMVEKEQNTLPEFGA